MSSLIFGWGLNQNKILTYPKKKTILHKPTLLTYFKNFKGIQNIACGTIRSIYLSKEGKFASFSRALLRRDFKLYDIKFVACSGEHFLIQNSKDELYVIGLNNFGQLGLENYRQRKTFQKQIFFEEHKIELKKIVFGKFSSYFLSKENGDFYGCGSNLNGELGLKYETVRVVSPRLLQSNIFNIFSGKGSKFVFILNKKGLFATGRNNCGQLGIGSERLKFFSFTKVPIPEEYTIVEIIGGANHTLLLALDGEFKQRFLASGTKFKCGLGENCFSFKEFTFFADKPIKQFDCGELHSMVLTQDSKLYVWGNSDYGQLGLGELTDKMTPTQLYIEELQNVKNLKIHAGSFSSFIWQESIEEIQEDFLNLFQNEYCWDLELYGFKVHKILVEHRLNSNLKKINKVLSNYSKSEIEILLYWVYSGSSDDIEILKQICLNFEIEDPLSKHLVDDLNELFESKKSADFVLKINETIKTGKKKKNMILNVHKKKNKNKNKNKNELEDNSSDNNENEDENDKKHIKEILLHKFVLCARSELFRGYFLTYNDQKNSDSDSVLDYSGKSFQSIQIFMQFLYTSKLKIENNSNRKLLFSELSDAHQYYQINTKSNYLEKLESLKLLNVLKNKIIK